jgi:hypothetical protein
METKFVHVVGIEQGRGALLQHTANEVSVLRFKIVRQEAEAGLAAPHSDAHQSRFPLIATLHRSLDKNQGIEAES